MSKKSISGVLWTKKGKPANEKPITPEVKPEMTEHELAADLMYRALARAARNRHNAEGFGE